MEYFKQALEICQKSLPADHLDIAECEANITRIYKTNKQPELAWKHQSLASKIEKINIRP